MMTATLQGYTKKACIGEVYVDDTVSYTHLDVYKRQELQLKRTERCGMSKETLELPVLVYLLSLIHI